MGVGFSDLQETSPRPNYSKNIRVLIREGNEIWNVVLEDRSSLANIVLVVGERKINL